MAIWEFIYIIIYFYVNDLFLFILLNFLWLFTKIRHKKGSFLLRRIYLDKNMKENPVRIELTAKYLQSKLINHYIITIRSLANI